jgi:MtN3 and saliva related transmembrane protein
MNYVGINELFSIIVLISGIVMSLGHFVQARKMFLRKSAKDISLGFILIFFCGSLIWLTYGFLIKDIVITLSFGIGALGTSLLLLLKIKFDGKKTTTEVKK